MRTHILLLTSALALVAAPALAFGSPPEPPAQTAQVECRLDFSLTGWAVIYKQAEGRGTVTCGNGQSAPVSIVAKGGGLVAGKYRIDDGNGRFNKVRDIRETFGAYAQAEAEAGVVKSGTAQVLTKGDVSLALAGKGRGWDIGISFGRFKIEPI